MTFSLILLSAGWYWIDPNLGVLDDAIYVFCNMSAGGHTCVNPDQQVSFVNLTSFKYNFVLVENILFLASNSKLEKRKK